jgi:hypothetical protein
MNICDDGFDGDEDGSKHQVSSQFRLVNAQLEGEGKRRTS